MYIFLFTHQISIAYIYLIAFDYYNERVILCKYEWNKVAQLNKFYKIENWNNRKKKLFGIKRETNWIKTMTADSLAMLSKCRLIEPIKR